MHTYTTFIRDVNVTTLESCTPDSLAILTPELCCQLLPLSRDLSYNPALIGQLFIVLNPQTILRLISQACCCYSLVCEPLKLPMSMRYADIQRMCLSKLKLEFLTQQDDPFTQ